MLTCSVFLDVPRRSLRLLLRLLSESSVSLLHLGNSEIGNEAASKRSLNSSSLVKVAPSKSRRVNEPNNAMGSSERFQKTTTGVAMNIGAMTTWTAVS